jgi:uncharacterized membrane protein YkvA (DUF1232 family)
MQNNQETTIMDTTITVNTEELLGKMKKVAKNIPFSLDAMAMYFLMLDRSTPTWAKATIAGALAYFVCPIDAIPDAILGLGYTDDAAVMLAAHKAVESNLKEAHFDKAEAFFVNA